MLKPSWVVPRTAALTAGREVRRFLRELGLATVCESARCPNRGECFSGGTATFLILGPACTRSCGFCAVEKGPPAEMQAGEAAAVAAAVRLMELDYVVVTSVTRDDLADGGARAFAAVIVEIGRQNPEALVEVLVPDFGGRASSLDTVLAAGPAVLNHNVETVPRLYRSVRPGADYGRSIELLLRAAGRENPPVVKSGMMLGLGERGEEVVDVMADLVTAGCRSLTLGQYLQPTRRNLPVARYLKPREFEELAEAGRNLGMETVVAGPLVRSSYRAEAVFQHLVSAQDNKRNIFAVQ